MANLAVTKSWSSEILKSADLNQNFTDIVNYINNRNGGGTAWDALSVTGTSTLTGAVSCGAALTVTGNLLTSGGPSTLTGYRRPTLTFINVTTVDVENNTGTANQTSILFPDGTVLSVTEDTSSTNKYRRFDITATANFTSGTEDSGLRSGLTEATNTWYAIYAVKSQINAVNFVLAGDTTLPLQANFATLNGRYGTNGWVYLGLIRNGDNNAATGDILSFQHSGPQLFFNNTTATYNTFGLLLASGSSVTSVTYTYSAGTGTTDIPNHTKLGIVSVYSTSTSLNVRNASDVDFYATANATGTKVARVFAHLSQGIRAAGLSSTYAICLSSIYDPLLGGDIGHTI